MEFTGQGRVKQGGKHETNDRGSIGAGPAAGGPACDGRGRRGERNETGRLCTVSYTHLDVYKRQGPRSRRAG